MTVDLDRIVSQALLTAGRSAGAAQGPEQERERLAKAALEFESMLMLQVLKDMRSAGRWEDDENDASGTQALFDTLDVELASYLVRANSLGLGDQLLDAFDRLGIKEIGSSASAAETTPTAVQEVVAPDRGAQPLTSPAAMHVTSPFGWRVDPLTGRQAFHSGVDVRAAYGQDVLAAAQGRVVWSGDQGGYGTTVVLEHGDGTRTRYAHLSATLVSEGDVVGTGDLLGRAGSSGRATGVHLHFEVIGADGRAVDPVERLSS